jgi:hypothetical protein
VPGRELAAAILREMSSDTSRVNRLRFVLAVVGAMVAVAGFAGCGSSDAASTPTTTAARSTGTSAATSAASTMRTKRYCEVLLVQPGATGVSAEVYNTYPLNDCPADHWAAMDATAIAAAEGVPLAILNGPRYWLMNRVEKTDTADRVTKTFGGMAMIREASVAIGSLDAAGTPYVPHEVNRSTVFTFDRGETVYELHAPDGSTYVMQTWSQQVDPTLAEADLAGLGPRLQLPAGWSYGSRKLTTPLRIETTTTPAHVLQDDLRNSYSLEAGA